MSLDRAIEAAAEALDNDGEWGLWHINYDPDPEAAARIAVEAAAPILTRDAFNREMEYMDDINRLIGERNEARERAEADVERLRGQGKQWGISLKLQTEATRAERALADRLAAALDELEGQAGWWTRKSQDALAAYEEARR